MNPVLLETNLPGFDLVGRGKGRDIYSIGNNALLIVVTDRLSAFDYILDTALPPQRRHAPSFSILACRSGPARRPATVLRQAICARLSRRDPLEQATSCAVA